MDVDQIFYHRLIFEDLVKRNVVVSLMSQFTPTSARIMKIDDPTHLYSPSDTSNGEVIARSVKLDARNDIRGIADVRSII